MYARMIAKLAAKAIVSSLAGGAVTKSMSRALPATQKFKVAEIAGSVVGGLVVDRLEERIDAAIDNWFDKRAAARQA